MQVIKYNPEYKDRWNAFIINARNSTFLFNRDFMQYHSDRFNDYSLLVVNDKDEIIAAIPANIDGNNNLHSHQGLTYGGLAVAGDTKLELTKEIFHAVLRHLSENGIEKFYLKQFPAFYNQYHTDELEYVLFLVNARLIRRDVALVIDQQHRLMYSGNIRREGNKAEKAGVIVREDEQLDTFWNQVLSPNLMDRFGVKPVHSLEEISLLKNRFPDNIKQYSAYLDGRIMAGATFFIAGHVAHCQYISASDEGRKNGSLNYMFRCLMDDTLRAYRYFDFGIANENNGRSLNTGMLFWKESFGGRAQRHDFYEIDPSNYSLIGIAQ